MKVSFYFVVWMVIYPILHLFGSEWIDRNSFFVALIGVWALSWLLNRTMPATISYERRFSRDQIMNEVYTGNVEGFRRRLSRMATVEFIGALYFGVTFVVTIFMIIRGGGPSGIFELVVFGFLAAGTIMRASKMQKYSWRLRRNPDPQESVAIVEEMGMNYSAYYQERQEAGEGSILPPPPANFSAFQIFSLIIAIVCAVLGIIFVILALLGMVDRGSFGSTSVGIMYLLYGSLATYYGARDCISSLSYFRCR